jgi:hypothetical protein
MESKDESTKQVVDTPESTHEQPNVTQESSDQPLNQPTTEPVSPKKPKKWLIPTLVVTLILALGTAGFFAYKYFFPVKQAISPYPQAPTSTPLVDPTTSWETFTNTKFGYTFKYPTGWTPTRGPGNLSDAELGKGREINVYDPQSTEVINRPGTGFTIDTNKLHKTGDTKNCSNLDDCIQKSTTFFPENAMELNTTFQNNPAKKITYDRETEIYTQTFSYVFTILNEDFYSFQIVSEKSDFTGVESTFAQILSTFKFTEQSTSYPVLPYNFPQNWKGVSDRDNVISIGYDPDKYNAASQEDQVGVTAKKGASSYWVKIRSYDGGSRHEFIRINIGANSLDALKTDDSSEKSYSIAGSTGLFLYNYDLSGSCSVGMIKLSSSSAALFETQMCGVSDIESILSTIQLPPR